MPNRIIKETICSSDTVDMLTWFEEVLFYRLIVNCDDYGRMDARLPILKARLFPLKSVTDKQIGDALDKLSTVGIVTVYEYDGRPYLQLVTWDDHQQVRAKKSKYPAFDETCKQMISDDIKCPRNPIQSESNPNPNPNPKERSAFDVALDDFRDFRKKSKKPLTERAEKLILSELEKLAENDEKKKIDILNQSIMRGWTGVFPLKTEAKEVKPGGSIADIYGIDV